MCRLFGLMSGEEPVYATFWLLEAPDSLSDQSYRNPDGAGIGHFSETGEPDVDKQPIAAYEDEEFARGAREIRAREFVAHVRHASVGGVTELNTHPFKQEGRIFAHNGTLGGLDLLDEELGPYLRLVHGQTDSERLFALITRRVAEADGDVAAGIVAAVTWVAQNLPVLSLNFVMIDSDRLWAFRYPETYELHILERGPGGPSGKRHLDHASAARSIRVRSAELADTDAVIIATEPMDEDPGWRMLESGELLAIGPDTHVESAIVLAEAPAHPLPESKPAPPSG